MNDGTADDTLEEHSEGDRAPLLPLRPHLFLVLEADQPVAGGARYALDDVDEVIIGRGRERQAERTVSGGKRQLFARMPGRWMSSKHARLVLERGEWLLEDAGSKNGTFLGGDPVKRERLKDGAIFDAGHTLFALHNALPTPRSSEADVSIPIEAAPPHFIKTLYPTTAMHLSALEKVAGSSVPLLLLGETGTGKELLARGVHKLSNRGGSFIAVNCGGLAPTLVESLLFGHVKGTFSGATSDAAGLVRAADRGTLFLDEIGDLPFGAQATLLRVLQEREVLPLGSTRPIAVDFRLVCATNQMLDALVDAGRFRSDLLARIDGFRHTLVPLRQRKGDLGVLIAVLLARIAPGRSSNIRFAPAAARELIAQEWPGNVRELEQTLARALALTSDGVIRPEHLGLRHASGTQMRAVTPEQTLDASAERLRAELIEMFARHNGSVTQVASSMGKARKQIQRWMHRFNIDPNRFRQAQ